MKSRRLQGLLNRKNAAGSGNRGVDGLIRPVVRAGADEKQVARRRIVHREGFARIDEGGVVIVCVTVLQRLNRQGAVHDVIHGAGGGRGAQIIKEDALRREWKVWNARFPPVSPVGPIEILT